MRPPAQALLLHIVATLEFGAPIEASASCRLHLLFTRSLGSGMRNWPEVSNEGFRRLYAPISYSTHNFRAATGDCLQNVSTLVRGSNPSGIEPITTETAGRTTR
jgi:hypothetical protein